MPSTTSQYYEGQYPLYWSLVYGSTSGLSEHTGVTLGSTQGRTAQHSGTTVTWSDSRGGATSSAAWAAGTYTTTKISTSSGEPTIQTNTNYYDSISTGEEFTTNVCSTRTITTSNPDQASTEQYQMAYTYTASRYDYNTASTIENTRQVPVINSATLSGTKTRGVYYRKTTVEYNTDDVVVYTIPNGFGAVPSIYPVSAVLQGTITRSVFGGSRDATIFGSVTTSQATSYETKTKTLTSASLSSFTYETNGQAYTHTAGSVSKSYTDSYLVHKTHVISADTNTYTTEIIGETVVTTHTSTSAIAPGFTTAYTTDTPLTNYGTTAFTRFRNAGTSLTKLDAPDFSGQTSKTSDSTTNVATYAGTVGSCGIVHGGINVTVMTPNLPDGFVGFGFSSNAQSRAVYKTISVGTSGSSFSNIETSGITSDLIIKKIGSYGGKLIVTGKCGLPANNSSRSLSWYTDSTTPEFGTASTLAGTHASTYTETYTNASSTLTSTLTSTAGMSFLFSCVSSITDKNDFVSIHPLESTKKYFQTYYASIGHHDALTRDRTLVFMPGDYTFHKTIDGVSAEVATHISDVWFTSIMPDSENWLIEKQDVYQCYTVNAPNQGVVQHDRFYNDWNYNWPPQEII